MTNTVFLQNDMTYNVEERSGSNRAVPYDGD